MLIRDFMTLNPVTVRANIPVEEIAKLLLAHRINDVPVVEAGSHRHYFPHRPPEPPEGTGKSADKRALTCLLPC